MENQPDWKYLGSRENPDTGSRRTETYTTNLYGTTKLRDGSAYLDPEFQRQSCRNLSLSAAAGELLPVKRSSCTNMSPAARHSTLGSDPR